jgi:hypothetical protein
MKKTALWFLILGLSLSPAAVFWQDRSTTGSIGGHVLDIN